MNRTERFYRIDQLLSGGRIVPFSTFLERLEVSPATVKRDLEYMRNRLNAPIVWDRDAGGYRFAAPERRQAQYELPG
ncbi:MAG: transcriptional regulator, partial [Pseudomonadota bacterium]|nr:transcriptional regulator [Pseudomonadota bacterium]